jgi:hypothetical protein
MAYHRRTSRLGGMGYWASGWNQHAVRRLFADWDGTRARKG